MFPNCNLGICRTRRGQRGDTCTAETLILYTSSVESRLRKGYSSTYQKEYLVLIAREASPRRVDARRTPRMPAKGDRFRHGISRGQTGDSTPKVFTASCGGWRHISK